MFDRSWMFDSDYFVIQKGWGTFDLTYAIEAALRNGISQVGYMDVLASMSAGRHDLSQHDLTGVEIDAIDLAIRNQGVSEEIAMILHDGPNHPQFKEAQAAAIRSGSVMINNAVTEQNRINLTRGIGEMKEPFEMDRNGRVSVHSAWQRGATTALENLRVPGGKNKEVTPFFENSLVTHIKSPLFAGVEGWARPYEEALQNQGLASKKRNDRYIRGHKATMSDGKKLVSFNDTTQAKKFMEFVEREGSTLLQSGMNPQQVVEQLEGDYLNTTAAFHTTGWRNHAFESTYARELRPDDGELPFTDEELMAEQDAKQLAVPGAPAIPNYEDMMSIIHPEDREQNWLRNMHTNTNAYLMDKVTGKKNQRVIDYLTSPKVKMTEDEAHKFIENVRFTPGRKGANVTTRFKEGLEQYYANHPAGMPPHYTGSVESTAEPLQTGEAAKPQTLMGSPIIDPTVAPPRETPIPPPPQGAVVPKAPSPTPIPPSPTSRGLPPLPGKDAPLGINANIPLSGTDERGIGGDSINQQLEEIIRRLSGGEQFLSKSDVGDIEDYFEMVQLELAKATIEDKVNVPAFDIDSPNDIAMMGGHIQRPTTDVIGILFTKGDWRNIAKNMGITHEQVQMVKVAFS